VNDESAGFAAWLATADNGETWARLRDSLALADGFELVFTVVVDSQAAAWISELLEARARELGRRFVKLDARDEDVLAKLVSLADAGEVLVVLDTVAASRCAVAALERCLLDLNPRRDLLATTIPGPLVIVARPDGLRRIADLAPDLFSVHTARFRLFGGAEPGLEEQPEWLLSDHEFVGLLGIDPSFGFADRSRVPKIVVEPPRPPERLFGRDAVLAELESKLVPGGERLIRVSGPPGVGRTALVARAVELVRERWDRVIWLDCRHMVISREQDEVIDAVIEALAPNEVPPFNAEDARERFIELTTLHAVLIITDDLFRGTRAVTGSRSCLVVIHDSEGGRGRDDIVVAPLGLAELQALGQAEGLPATVDLQALSAGLPACVRLLGRWLHGQGEAGIEDLARITVDNGGHIDSPRELCEAIATGEGRACVHAFEALLRLDGWVLEFPRGWTVVTDLALAEFERLGVLVAAGDGYRFAETSIGQWHHLPEAPLFGGWRARLPHGSGADQLYATLSLFLRTRSDGFDLPRLTRDDVERAAISAAPPQRAAILHAAASILRMPEQDKLALLRAALSAALRCGQVEHARNINLELPNSNESDMLVMLRPSEWGSPSDRARASAAALRRGLGHSDSPDDPLPDAAPARAALALRTPSCSPATIGELLASLDATHELDRLAAHFLWARLAWLQIAANDWPGFERSLAEVERSARAWGYPYALVRLRLLDLTALEVRGELDRAAAKLPATLAAVERRYGSRSHTTLELLRRATQIYTELDRDDDAKQTLAQIHARRHET